MRLFAAIEIDDAARAELAEKAAELKRAGGARFPPPENYHLTLRFFGEVEGQGIEALREALDELGPPPAMELPLVGPRWFPGPSSPRVLLATAEAPDALYDYQRGFEQAARAVGLAAERKPYIPHVTIARIRDKRSARALSAHAAALEGRWATLRVRAAALIESTLGSSGATYRSVDRYVRQDQ